MNRKPKAKQKRALPLSLDFVTALTPDECRDVLHLETARFAEVEWQLVESTDEGLFTLERSVAFALTKPSPLRFTGTLTEDAQGTRIQGQIMGETLAHIHYRIRIRRYVYSLVLGLVFFFSLFAWGMPGEAWYWVVYWSIGMMIALFPILAVGAWIFSLIKEGEVDGFAKQLIDRFEKVLYVTPGLFSLEDNSGDDHESQAKSEAETRAAAESGLRDRAHTG